MKEDLLRRFIKEEMAKLITDDAIFSDMDDSGILDDFDIPGDVNPAGRNLSYGRHKADDREGKMTRGHLYYIANKSQSLHDILRDDDDLPEWVQSKIARAAEKIQSVYNYLDYKINRMNDH